LGGEKLRLSKFAPLLLGAWFLVQIPSISAQEVLSQGEDTPSQQAQERDPRAWERSVTFSDNEGANTAPGGSAAGPSIWSVIRMLLVLALSAAAVYGIVFFIKRSSKQTVNKDPFLKVLAVVHLGSNRYAHIVAVGTKAWLLGSSDGGVSLIGEIEDKDVLDAMLLEDSRKTAEAGSAKFLDFMSILRRFGIQPESKAPSADDIRKHRERLKGL